MPSSVPLISLFLALSRCSSAYNVEPRANHHSTLIGNILMIYGGQTTINGELSNTLILLPIDQNFDTTSPPYGPNSGVLNPGLGIHGGVMFPGGQNYYELLIYGGNNDGNVELSIYDQESNNFNNSFYANDGEKPCDSHSGVANIALGKAYIFGGKIFPNDDVALSGLLILDIMQYSWSYFQSDIPLPRQDHTATLTADGRMVVIGGQTNLGIEQTNPAVVPMSNIDIFDTILQKWSRVNASNPPQPRLSHTAVCTDTNQIIVFGGNNGTLGFLGDLVVLDMNISPPSWSTLNAAGNPPTPRYGHSATIVGTIMFIIYGQTSYTALDSNIYALDTIASTWTINYIPNHLDYTWPFPIPTNNSSSNTDVSNSGPSKVIIIIISVLGGIVVVVCCCCVFYFCCYKRRKSHDTKEKKNETEIFPQASTIYYERPHTVEDSQKIESSNLEDLEIQTRKPDEIV